jgi:predicted NUDIX family phosphoesterase
MAEQVLVARRVDLFPAGFPAPSGFQPGNGSPYLARIQASGFFLGRADAEEDPNFKQIIPYGVLTAPGAEGGGEAEDGLVLLLRRTAEAGEARLRDLYTLGIGGHINPIDAESSSPAPRGQPLIEAALRRELDEELEIACPLHLELAGVINDDTNPVGRVHFGVVYRVRAQSSRVRVREASGLEGDFVSPSELARHAERMETWSRFLLTTFWPSPIPAAG